MFIPKFDEAKRRGKSDVHSFQKTPSARGGLGVIVLLKRETEKLGSDY